MDLSINKIQICKSFINFVYLLHQTTNSVLTYANLVSLGSCLATTIPVDKLSTLNSTDFLNYYSTIGKTYQPDAAEAAIVAQKLAEVSAAYDPASFVFNTAGDLALFYNNYANLNAVLIYQYFAP